MNKIKLGIFGVIFAIAQVSFATSSPVPMLEGTANKILSVLKENKSNLKNNQNVIYDAVSLYLLPNVDVKGMARSVLGRNAWNNATPADRKEFTESFTQLVIHTYASPLAEYTDETVRFLPQRGAVDSKFTRVSSIIERSNGQNIPLNYSLVFKKSGWKIYDLSVEGVSLLQSFRSQFSQALQTESLHELIAKMRKNSKAA